MVDFDSAPPDTGVPVMSAAGRRRRRTEEQGARQVRGRDGTGVPAVDGRRDAGGLQNPPSPR
jgi:hypothetical protein